MTRLFTYVITQDGGFAPNPFHGVLTLNCCKPEIRKQAEVGDWVAGNTAADFPGGRGLLVYAMRVTDKMTMSEYDAWTRQNLPEKIPDWRGPWERKAGDSMYTVVSKNLDPHGIIRKHESVLGRPQTEDSRRRERRRTQGQGRHPVRGEPLLGQTLRQDGARGRVALAPKKPPGRPPKGTDATRRLLEADLAERQAASAPERRRYLERMRGESMSDSTVRRLVRRLGHSRKKIRARLRARRVPESGLAGDGLRGALRQKARVLKDEMGSNTSLHEL